MRSASANTASMSCSIRRMVTPPLSSRSIVHHAGGFFRPHAGHRLVEQQQARPGGERHGDFELAVLAVAEPVDAHVGALRRARRAPSAARAGSRKPSSRRASRQKRNEWPQCACTASATLSSAVKSRNSEVIWNERASPSRLRRWTGSAVMSPPSKRMLPPLWRDLAGQQADQRGLAGAVRADDGVQFAARDIERDGVGGDDAAEALGQALDLQQRLSHGARLSNRPAMPPCR